MSSRDSLIAIGGALLGAGAALAISSTASAKRNSFDEELGPRLVRKLSFRTPPCVVVVDPFSSGMMLCSMLVKHGYAVIRVLSNDFGEQLENLVPKNIEKVRFVETVRFTQFYHGSDEDRHSGSQAFKAAVDAIVRRIISISDVHVENFMVGCESGVELMDSITEQFKIMDPKNPTILTNGSAGSLARRDKWEMGEKVRRAGVRAVGQIECKNGFHEAKQFINQQAEKNGGDFSVVLKPAASAGSEGVHFASTMEDAEKYYNMIYGEKNVFGFQNNSVLVQEFLAGKEYVVDSVSVEGIHKTVAIYEYDKRETNGAKFVYFGMRLYESEDGERERILTEYMHSVLDALDVRHGPSHGEVMWTSSGPCLVEVGCRPHGGEGTFVAMVERPIGYSQLSVMIDSHENRSKFFALPDRPKKHKAFSMEVCLVSYETGTFLKINEERLKQIEALESFIEAEIKIEPKSIMAVTIDFITSPGAILLCHESKEVIERDQEFIHSIRDLFILSHANMHTL